MDVLRLDEYKRIRVEGREAASFAANAVNMATAYGLALQGVGLAPIAINLMPVQSLRQQVWHSKTKWFAAAAALIILGTGTMFIRPLKDAAALRTNDSTAEVERVIRDGQRLKKEYQDIEAQAAIGYTAENYRRLLDNREIWPFLLADAASAVATTLPQPALMGTDLKAIEAIPPAERKLVVVEKLDGAYAHKDGKRRMSVTMEVMFSHGDKTKFLNDTIGEWLRQNAERPGVPYKIDKASISVNPAKLAVIAATGEAEKAPIGKGSDNSPPQASGDEGPVAPPPPKPTGGFGGTVSGRRGGEEIIEDPMKGRGFGGTSGTDTGFPTVEPTDNVPAIPSMPENPTGSPGDQNASTPVEIDTIAPIPRRPALFKAGQQYFRVPITFEVELIEVAPVVPPAQAANAQLPEVRS